MVSENVALNSMPVHLHLSCESPSAYASVLGKWASAHRREQCRSGIGSRLLFVTFRFARVFVCCLEYALRWALVQKEHIATQVREHIQCYIFHVVITNIRKRFMEAKAYHRISYLSE